MKALKFVLLVLVSVSTAKAASFQFDLSGNAGAGLLGGNENPAVVGGGSGGELGMGISLDTDTNTLSINVGWGTGNGFTDLTGPVTAAHLHGGAGIGISDNAGVLADLSSILAASASTGGLSGSIVLSDTNEGHVLNGNTYINVHTAANGAGEIRGQLTVVPEPTTYAILTGLACLGVAGWRRRSIF